ncbi:RPM1-interacting protein 4-like isoform X1 [Cynara cardunculus var. scolymus]|uniref:RPM1-interacting protein 4-like isoform X1 n=1 Tax=Cynara cardunculus var. scolymus TaxID=59895 RepID=UPI000D62F19F|nr:RPM1-interacting protein 4-like isoform X1 [Cynara cardunculus var. scolymus]
MSSELSSILMAQDETEVKSGDSTKFEPDRPKGASKTKLVTHVSREEIDLIKSSDSPTRPIRTTRQSVGSDQSIDNSPMHPHPQARVGNRGSAGSSPMWDRKVSSESSHGAASSTPGRSRLKQVTRGEETVDDGPAIPKFGDWDDNDPTAGEGYTQLFNKAREDRHNGGAKSPMITIENANFYGQNRHGNDNTKGCGCFSWSRK